MRQDRRDRPTEAESGKERRLSKELETTFPASDPPSVTQPGSGVTGDPSAASERKRSKPK